MKKAEFLPSLYTHNAIIDAQHQELINTINKLYEAIDSGKGTDEAKNALAFLMQYIPSLPSTKLRMTLLWKRSRGCIRS